MLTADPDPNNLESVTQKFDIDGDPVFTAKDPDPDDVWACVAKVMARFARGEDYSDVELPGENEWPDASLDDFSR